MKSKQSKGGTQRAKSLSPEQRSEIAKKAAQSRWNASAGRPLEAETDGVLKIGEVDLDVYVLNDRRRVINKKAMAKALTLKSEGGSAFIRTMTRPSIQGAISLELKNKISSPIVFTTTSGASADGYEASVLIEVCDALIEARNKGLLNPSQIFLAQQAEIIVRSAAKVGLVALIDEATGYQDKTKFEYKELFDQFIRDEFRQWEKEFPNKFFEMIYRIYRLKRHKPDTNAHPQFFGKFIRRYIYYPLAQSNGAILEKLDEKNPVVYAGGGRRYKFTQFLTDEIGMDAFRQHLWQVIGIGEASNDKRQFDLGFYRAFPYAIPKKDADQLDFFDEFDVSVRRLN
mgnify:FL=1